jgi:mono/diheme cytochrome c family protein
MGPLTRPARLRACLLGAVQSVVALASINCVAGTIDAAQVERGRYIALLGDCAGCHTAEGGAALAGGKGIVTRFGTIYASNITPERQTGIGTWTADDFWRLMHQGVRKDGSLTYPAMPYPWYTKMTRADSDALKAYLDTFEPVSNRPPDNDLLPPMEIRESVAAWNALFFKPSVFAADAARSAAWNRGAYIVEGLGHCGACHTPTNILSAPERHRALKGNAVQNWWAPALTQDGTYGVAGWDAADIARYLKTGRNDYSVASGPMAEVVENSTQYLTDADLEAVAAYLRDVPGGVRKGDRVNVARADAGQLRAGEALFRDNCAGCHAMDGSGVPGLVSSLQRNGVVNAPEPVGVLRIILAGAQGNVTKRAPTRPGMPAFAWKFDDREVAAVATYVRQSLRNNARAVTVDQVADLRRALARGN